MFVGVSYIGVYFECIIFLLVLKWYSELYFANKLLAGKVCRYEIKDYAQW